MGIEVSRPRPERDSSSTRQRKLAKEIRCVPIMAREIHSGDFTDGQSVDGSAVEREI